MRRRGAALVEFGLVVGVLIALVTSVAAFAPIIATKSKVVDATFAAALEASTYRAPDEVATSLQGRDDQYARLCYNSALVAYRMLSGAGLDVGTSAPTVCKEDGAATDRMWVSIASDSFVLGTGAIPKSPISLCVSYRYEITGGITYAIARGFNGVDSVTVPSIPVGACTAVYLDDDRTEDR